MHRQAQWEKKIQDSGQCERNVIINIIHSIRDAQKIVADMDHYFYATAGVTVDPFYWGMSLSKKILKNSDVSVEITKYQPESHFPW